MSYALLVQKNAEPTQPTFEKKVGRRSLPEPTPNGKHGKGPFAVFWSRHFDK